MKICHGIYIFRPVIFIHIMTGKINVIYNSGFAFLARFETTKGIRYCSCGSWGIIISFSNDYYFNAEIATDLKLFSICGF